MRAAAVPTQIQIPARRGHLAAPADGNAVKTGLLDLAGTPPAYMANLVKLVTGFTPTTKSASEMRKNGAWDIFRDLFAKQAKRG